MKHWNSYWSATKTLNSFAEGEHCDGYVGEIAGFWNEVFAMFPQTANILDLATGNGGLAVLAKKFNPNFKITASDAANISPLALYKLSDTNYHFLRQIEFIGNTPSENLVFENEKFDHVISQFGFEYADSLKAIAQVKRVLKPNGKFIALIHHQDSFISKDCKVGLSILERLEYRNGLLSKLQDFGEFCQSITDKNELNLKQQEQFKEKNICLLELYKGLQNKCCDESELSWCNLLLKELLPLIMEWKHTNSIKVAKARENLKLFELRLKDQQSAAMSRSDIAILKDTANRSWSECTFEEVYLDKDILCWKFHASK